MELLIEILLDLVLLVSGVIKFKKLYIERKNRNSYLNMI